MTSARDCAQLLLETMPSLRRRLASFMRQRKGGDYEPLTMDQVRLLKLLGHKSWTLGELAARHGVLPSTMSRSVDVLVRREWISRDSDPADRRQVILRLTDAGRAAYTEVVQHAEDMLTQLIEELSDAERERLFDGMSVLHALLTRRRIDDDIGEPDRHAC